MLISSIDKPFINLVTDAEGVMLDAKVSNYLQLLSGIHLHILKERVQPVTTQHTRKQWVTACIQDTPTFPVGLCGVFSMMALVLELNLLSSS